MPLDICFPHSFETRWWMMINSFPLNCRFCPERRNVVVFLWVVLYRRVRIKRCLDSYKPSLQSSISPTLKVCCFCNCQTALLLSSRKHVRLHGYARRKGLVHSPYPLYFVPLSRIVLIPFACFLIS